MLRFPSHSPEAEQSRERSHEAALKPSGLRALILIIISSQEVLRQFITKMTVHPRHITRREEHTSTICLSQRGHLLVYVAM